MLLIPTVRRQRQRQRYVDLCEFDRMSSRTARVIQGNAVLKNQKSKPKQNNTKNNKPITY